MQQVRNEVGSVLVRGLCAGCYQIAPVVPVQFHEAVQVVLCCVPVIDVEEDFGMTGRRCQHILHVRRRQATGVVHADPFEPSTSLIGRWMIEP